MSNDSGSSAVERNSTQSGGMSGYFHGFFGTSRKLEMHADPIHIPKAAPAESRMDTLSPFTPPADDWTFGIFRKYSLSEEGTSLPQSSNALGGFLWSNKPPLPTENLVNQQIASCDNGSASHNKSNATQPPVGEITSRVRRDSDQYGVKVINPLSSASTDVVDSSMPAVSQEFGKGAILSAYISQQQQVGLSDRNRNLAGSMDPIVASSMNSPANTTMTSANKGDSVVSATAAPHLHNKRRSLFDNERIEVKKSELNMIAPTSM